jgi:anti-sigma factor RsiW
MHYNEDALYFYSKGDCSAESFFEISVHIEACPRCAEKLKEISSISSLINGTLRTPPPLVELMSRKRRRFGVSPASLFKSGGLAIAATLVIAVSAAVFFGRSSVSKEKELDFVYKTYALIYNYDYFKQNYIDGYNITFIGGNK